VNLVIRHSSLVARRFLLVLLLLVATAVRVIGLDNFPTPQGATPPGLEHDEVAHWLINQDILAGNHALYFTEAYGHEALYHYAQAAFGALVGDHALALRLPSAYLGVLLVAAGYALGRRLFGVRVGLLSAAFLAVLFWPVFYSRLALRAMALPVLAGLSAIAWWRGWGNSAPAPASPARLIMISGLLAGLSLHTYMAARAVPIFYALFTVYLALFHRAAFRARWRGIVVFWLALAAVALPLVIFLAGNPGAEARIGEVDAPLRALLAGDPRLVLSNAAKIAAGFALRGDPLWRQGIAGRPIFDPVLGALFYAGVALCLWRWREPRYAFLLLWLAASVIPSLVTVDAPSTIRMITLVPVVMIFPLLAVARLSESRLIRRARDRTRFGESRNGASVKSNRGRLIHVDPQLSTVWTRLSTDLTTSVLSGALLVLWLYHAWSTVDGLWRVWPANDEVQFVWQSALTEAAAYLDATADAGPVAVGGWTPDTMDPPTMELSLRRDDLALGFFNPAESLLLPNPAGGAVRLMRPAILPLAPELAALTGPWEVMPANVAPDRQFALYRYETLTLLRPVVPADETFGDEVQFLGHDFGPTCAGDNAPCTLVTYWRVLAPAGEPRRFFLHVVGPDGAPVAQDDRLGAPAEHWRPGDMVVQLLSLPRTDGEVRLGVYDPTNGRRLLTEVGEEYSVFSIQ